MFHLFNSNTMNRYSSLLCMAALSLMTSLPMQAQSTELLPKPHILTHTDCVPFALGRAVQLDDPSGCAYLRTVLENYGCTLSDRDRCVGFHFSRPSLRTCGHCARI